MTDNSIDCDAPPPATVRRRGSISLVWLIPLVAAISGGWLIYKTISERGPTVRIEFKTASGIEAGQTKVKFKDVEVGRVTATNVSSDLKTVMVTIAIAHDFGDNISEHSRFWVERPRVTATGVSGLETLLSGAYIALDPGEPGRFQRVFKGLEEPPLFSTSEPGTQFVLNAPSLGSLNIGSPVYFRQIQVGQVVGYSLDKKTHNVAIEIFIGAPNDALVTASTRFWNASGIDVSLSLSSGSGIKVDTQSLLSVLIGGLAFDTPNTISSPTEPGPRPLSFPLYPSRDEAYAKTFSRKVRYLLFFGGSVRGLSVGAPVQLRGIEIGRVLDFQLQYDLDQSQFHIPVLIEIEPDRVAMRNASSEQADPPTDGLIEQLVIQGLRGQLKTSSLLTGDLYVDLDFHPQTPVQQVSDYGHYHVIPTVPTSLATLTSKSMAILDKLNQVPYEKIGKDIADAAATVRQVATSPQLRDSLQSLENTMDSVRSLAARLDQDVAPQLAKALEEASRTLNEASDMMAKDSSVYIELQRMIQEISRAARSVRVMADTIERNPESLIQGKGRMR